jgi:hypothetical protein
MKVPVIEVLDRVESDLLFVFLPPSYLVLATGFFVCGVEPFLIFRLPFLFQAITNQPFSIAAYGLVPVPNYAST